MCRFKDGPLLHRQYTPVMISSGFVARFAFSVPRNYAVALMDLLKAPKYLFHCYVFVILFYDKKSWTSVLQPQPERQL